MFMFVLMFFLVWLYKYVLNSTLKYKRHAFIHR